LDDFAKLRFSAWTIAAVPRLPIRSPIIVAALNAIVPYDWVTIFCATGSMRSPSPAPLEGLRRGGYKLVYTDTPSDFQKSGDEKRKHLNLDLFDRRRNRHQGWIGDDVDVG
jgi:hypothetical protein